jgi:hypothetical protein
MKRIALALLLAALSLRAAEHRGRVLYGGLPVPGAGVTATQGGQKRFALTDDDGRYVIPDLAGGVWTVEVEMQLFRTERREVAVADGASEVEWELRLAEAAVPARPAGPPAAGTRFQRAPVRAAAGAAASVAAAPPDPAAAAELAERAADGLLINGSANNPAASVFAQLPTFGNYRRGQRPLYNGNLGLVLNASAFDARSYSLTGQNTPKPDYRRVQGLLAFGGPLKIPGLIRRNGPVFTLNYQWARTSNARTQTGLLPTASERAGDFSAVGRPILDPAGGPPFAGNLIPASRISPQARALLTLFPAPNFTGDSRYNHQVALTGGLHQDDLQARLHKQVRRHFFSGHLAAQSVRSDTTDLFGLLDTGRTRGLAVAANYRRSFSPRSFLNTGLQFNRLTRRTTPYFAGRENISAAADITGNNQEAINWGPPALLFTSGYSSLTPAQAALDRNQTAGISVDTFLNRGAHNLTFGYTHRRQQTNVLAQQDARGTFTFTGAAAGHDLAGFVLGVPDASSIAFGNADKYLRAAVNEAFVNDDWRVNPGLTINAGLRWEYWAPAEEKYGRLVNLAIAEGFRAATPKVARDGAPEAFPRPDRNNLAPRAAFSWRPLAAASLVVRGGYGIYYDTSIYTPIALRMAQQAPLARSLRVANSAAQPLTLAAGFPAPAAPAAATTFGVDPNLRTGYAQTWQLSLQSDLRGAMQWTAVYTGSKGTRAQQQSLPNTYPWGAVAPAGFTYLASNGNGSRHAVQVQLRRRLRSGFTASASYTFARAIDNSSLGGRNQGATLTAQDWLDFRAERARSNFDQRHVFTGMAQYTTGMGLRGGTLITGRRAALWKEWTLGVQVDAASGLPLTPSLPAATPGTGVTGSLRPDYTGAPLYAAPPGRHLNPEAFRAPAAGRWGNAGRNSINGPAQLVVNGSLGRTFRSTERVSLDFRLEAANLLNHVTFPSWNAVLGSAQFGLPAVANPMRTVQAALRMRF